MHETPTPTDAFATPRVMRYDAAHVDVLNDAFRTLNLEWIEAYFSVEPPDEAILNHPQTAILDDGGMLFFVVNGTPDAVDRVLGTCAMVPHGDDAFELVKMAVASHAQSNGYGRRLLDAALDFARERGARRVVLASNRKLEAAIHLYASYGFQYADLDLDNAYARGDVEMELVLT